VFKAVVMVIATLIGLFAVGLTEFDGSKLHVAPVGNPEHDRFTPSESGPAVVTWKVIGADVTPAPNVRALTDGVVRLKSTTLSVTAAS
jgi:hypothetical protein